MRLPPERSKKEPAPQQKKHHLKPQLLKPPEVVKFGSNEQ